MKKNYFCLILIGSLGCFMSYKDDDKNEPPFNFSEGIAGIYKGDLTIRFADADTEDTILQKICISSVGSQIVKMELRDFIYNNFPIGDILVESVAWEPVAGNSNAYIFTGEQADCGRV